MRLIPKNHGCQGAWLILATVLKRFYFETADQNSKKIWWKWCPSVDDLQNGLNQFDLSNSMSPRGVDSFQ